MGEVDPGRKSWRSIWKGFVATCGASVLTFLGSWAWNTHLEAVGLLNKLREDVKELQSDRAKWGTLAEIDARSILLEREMYRLKGIYEYEMAMRAIEASQGKLAQRPLPNPVKEPKPDPIPLVPLVPLDPVPAEPSIPSTKPPPRAYSLDPDQFRKMQQERYQTPPK